MATSNGNAAAAGVAARLARKNILELHPYRCARDDYSDGILLDANENAYGPALSTPNEHTLERYPDPYQIPLKEKLSAYRGHGLVPANIFVGVGSDEAIDLLMRIFCRPGIDKILTTPPTYGMYKVCAKVNDVEMVNVPLTPAFDLVVPEVGRRQVTKSTLVSLLRQKRPGQYSMQTHQTCASDRFCKRLRPRSS
jgi:histidinol-phosphate aminotransferase